MDSYSFDLFENCEGLEKRRNRLNGLWHIYSFSDFNLAYKYYVKGFKTIYVVYNSETDTVLWKQEGFPGSKRGIKVWEAMRPEQRKKFLFNLDWFLGE